MKNFDLIKLPFSKENPILVQVLGVCSCLAVTAQLKPAVVMALSVTVVVVLANVIISLLRNTIPPRIRIIVQLVVVSTLVVLREPAAPAHLPRHQRVRPLALDASEGGGTLVGGCEQTACQHVVL
ncbi:MAG: hypothetical protein IKM79_07570, partial [Bacteroidales bacterium]|nr:hypothetical protein [Bacteroidales bacterium]